jgi:hypothetical protein
MSGGLGSAGIVPQVQKIADEIPHIVVIIGNSEPIDLLDFTA